MKIKPEWEVNKEAEGIVERLCELYPEKVGHVSPDFIGCAQIVNKDQPENQEWNAKLVGVREPVTLYCPKRYIIEFYRNKWEMLNKAQKAVLIMSKLLRIPEDPDGSMLAEDLKDVKCLVKTFGVDYLESPTLPDMSAERVTF